LEPKADFALTNLHEAGTSKTGFGQVKIMKEFFEYKENISKFGFRASR
jgi:hypothetical protein